VLWDCDQHWRNQGEGPWVAQSELEAVNAKLDNLAQLVSVLAQGEYSTKLAEIPQLAILGGSK
jgi:hypothetical protein